MHVQDRMPVVGDHTLARNRAPADGLETARDAIRSHADHFHGQREAPQDVHLLGGVGDAQEALRQVGDDLLARQGRAAALDHVAARVDLVGAVHVERQPVDLAGLEHADAVAAQPRRARVAARHRAGDALAQRGQRVDEVVHRRSGTHADDAARQHMRQRRLGHHGLDLVLRHEVTSCASRWAVMATAMNSSTFNEAPPSRPPSTSGIASSSGALARFMLPP
mmetsp:Transcript_38708/g.90599  ORF Transcript_38708/g.90599 Transcript_38708/m.90599 type:complete len:222 (+) Transcript_38708:533-1198(+)